jgi:Spy/CpxP family protein refolding chaperone
MKKVFSLLVIMTMVLGLSAQEQRQMRKAEFNRDGFMQANPRMIGPEFTPEQLKQISEFKFTFQKELVQINNLLDEKKAQLKTLEQVEKPDMKSINAKIDEITNLQNKKMKLSADHKAKVRSVLTEKQRVWMDSRGEGMKGRMGDLRKDVRKPQQPQQMCGNCENCDKKQEMSRDRKIVIRKEDQTQKLEVKQEEVK